MGAALADLVDRLEAAVPARDGTPSAAQYQRAVKDAVADYSRRAPMIVEAELEILSGTERYTLPADFIRLISLASLSSPNGVLVTPAGLVPVPMQTSERASVRGLTLVFYPTPEYSLTRAYRYAAAHVLDEDDEYPYLTDEQASTALIMAQSLALIYQANKVVGDAWQYGIGDQRVNKERLAGEIRAQADALREAYLAAVESQAGVPGMRS